MRCPVIIDGGKKCNIENGKKCPSQWTKHAKFDPKVLKIFFLGTEFDKDLDKLADFCCHKHAMEFQRELAQSRRLSNAKQQHVCVDGGGI